MVWIDNGHVWINNGHVWIEGLFPPCINPCLEQKLFVPQYLFYQEAQSKTNAGFRAKFQRLTSRFRVAELLGSQHANGKGRSSGIALSKNKSQSNNTAHFRNPEE
jgi:hypothetical protein